MQADTAVIRSAEISSCVVFPDSGRFTSRALHICISVLLSCGAGRKMAGSEAPRLFSNTHTHTLLAVPLFLWLPVRLWFTSTCHSSWFGEAQRMQLKRFYILLELKSHGSCRTVVYTAWDDMLKWLRCLTTHNRSPFTFAKQKFTQSICVGSPSVISSSVNVALLKLGRGFLVPSMLCMRVDGESKCWN